MVPAASKKPDWCVIKQDTACGVSHSVTEERKSLLSMNQNV